MSNAFDLSTLSEADLRQAEDFLRETLQDEFPTLDLKTGGVWNRLLLKVGALFHVLNQKELDNVRRSNSLMAINADPSLATPGVVDAVMSNYLVTRQMGTKATGYVTIALSAKVTTIIPMGTTFTTGTLVFVAEQTYVGVTTTTLSRDTERPLVECTDGTDVWYEFTVPVAAMAEGVEYNIPKGTVLSASVGITSLLTIDGIVATSDFANGTVEQTNEDLTDQLKDGITAKVLSGRQHIRSLLETQVPSITSMSIIGAGDPEMLRDRHNIFRMSHMGKTDIYAQTCQMPVRTTLELTGTLIDVERKLWQVSISRDAAPGFYTIETVISATAGRSGTPLEVDTITKMLDLSDKDGVKAPDIEANNLIEGAYSAYQTAVVTFTDPSTLATAILGATALYNVDVYYLPYIATLQDFVSKRSNRNPQADYLVRAPIPFFTAVTLTVKWKSGTEQPDEAAIQQAVMNVINARGFSTPELDASEVVAAVKAVIGKNADVVTPIELVGRLYTPVGRDRTYRSTSSLVIPTITEQEVSSRTVAFFSLSNSVSVTFVPTASADI